MEKGMRVRRFVKRIVALAGAAVMAGAIASAFTLNELKSKFVTDGSVSAALTVGKYDPAKTAASAVNIYAALLESTKREVSAEAGKVVIEKGVEIAGAVPLYKDSNKLVLKESLDNAISTISTGVVFGTGEFKDKNDKKYTYTMVLKPGSSAQITYKDKPDTDDDDPVLMIYGGTNEFYTLEVSFTSAIDSNAVKGKEIILFGKKYYFDKVDSTGWVLYEAANEHTMNIGDTVEFNNKTVKLVDIVEQSGSWYVIVDVEGTQETIEVGSSKTVSDIEVYVANAWVSKTQIGVGYAKLLLGSSKLDLTGTYPKIGDTEIRNVEIIKADTEGLKLKIKVSEDTDKNYLVNGNEFVDPLFRTFKIVFTSTDFTSGKQKIEIKDAANDQIDLVIIDHRGNTKTISPFIKYSGGWKLLGIDSAGNAKWEGQIVPAGTDLTVNFSDTTQTRKIENIVNNNTGDVDVSVYVLDDGIIHKIDIYGVDDADNSTKITIAVDGGSLTTINFGSEGTLTGTTDTGKEASIPDLDVKIAIKKNGTDYDYGNDTKIDTLYVSHGLKIGNGLDGKEVISVGTDYYITIVEATDRASYLLKFKSWDKTNDKVEFEDVFSGDTITAYYSSTTNIGKINIAGNDYYFVADEASDKLKFPDSGATELTLYLKDEVRLETDTSSPIVTNGIDIKIIEHSTDAASGTLEIGFNFSNNKIELHESLSYSGVMDKEEIGTSGDHRALTSWGTYVEYKEGDSYYLEAYVPKEQVWYDIKLAPTEAATEAVTVEYAVGEEIPGVGKVKGFTGVEAITYGSVSLEVKEEALGDKSIVVGTTLGNEKVAELLGALTPEAGKAIIKLMEEEGKPIVLIAGVSVDDVIKASEWLASVIKTGEYGELADAEAIEYDTAAGTATEISE